MEKLGLNDIRSMFRDFYVSKGHYPGKSASLIPKNDKSLLIINSGMAPLKPYFLGIEEPPKHRMTTCQKCIRTGDIENVGITARHGTFFEMLGNFSFGDYFKKESLTWGWEFITEYLKLPPEKIWATVYQDDDEAVEIWKSLGMPENRIVRLGKEDNFWEIGLGPCGPCSEIYYDRGPEYGCGKPDCKPGCECDRYLEFWNHVFSQFDRQEDGSYKPMAHPNIDTGMGLERMACIMQGVDSIFDIDTIRHILNGVVDLCHIPYEQGNDKADISIRIITDHIRSIVFMIADGIKPSNEGRGYVLRRLTRRAIRHGRLLGIEGSFLSGLVDLVVEVSGDAYPEIVQKETYIKKTIAAEEDKFEQTLDQGNGIINGYIDELKAAGSTVLDGDKAFKLYDTYGFPVELTQEILADYGFTADMEGFHKNMQRQKEMARSGRKDISGEAWKKDEIHRELPKTEFTGYDELVTKAEVIAMYDKDGEAADELREGEEAVIYLDKTPFYAESGGQVSDNGFIANDAFEADVVDVRKADGVFAHTVKVTKGSVSNGDEVVCNVNIYKRNSTARNHTATHLLQKALREVLGEHVEQAGSKNDENLLRFDFTHFEAMTQEEIDKVEAIVNQKITEFLPVNTTVMDKEEAEKTGAMMLFGEKYGDKVRVVNAGDWSIEFCAGTHVKNTGEIGALRIISESGVAAGVRRIEAVTGLGVLTRDKRCENIIGDAGKLLKANPENLSQRIEQLQAELKDIKAELAEKKKAEISQDAGKLLDEAEQIGDIKLVTKAFKDTEADDLRSLTDKVKAGQTGVVTVFASDNGGKVVLIVSVSDDLTAKGYNAGKLVKAIASNVKGGGGGRADMAQAGGKDPSGIPAAFQQVKEILNA
ncbi:MAG: alanine--tRNA ligase [Eubacteriales bacterium]|nr:alanine--tRNA ligase [Eubacteriales bacterium]